MDEGPWQAATLDQATTDRYGWKLFRYTWTGATAGEHTLVSRVTDTTGTMQPTLRLTTIGGGGYMSLHRELDICVTVLVVVAAGLVIWRQFVPVEPSQASQARPRVEDAKGTVPAEIATNVRGTGQVALVEFSDFECPFCGQHVRDVDPMIREAFVETGVVRQVFVSYPLSIHRRAQAASEAATCAGNQGRFWEMHHALFRDQAALEDRDLQDRARELGLDMALFSQCLRDGDARSLIERNTDAGRALDVRATPSFSLGSCSPTGRWR